MSSKESKGDHFVTVEWHDYSFSPTESLTCKAEPDAICHAVWDCECESWEAQGIDDGVPWHEIPTGDQFDSTARHFGRLDPTECDLVNWFDNSEEVMRGSVTFPVVPTFHGDHYSFEPAEETS